MAKFFSEESVVPESGHQEISQLADAWADLALKVVLQPDEDDILKISLGEKLHHLRRRQ